MTLSLEAGVGRVPSLVVLGAPRSGTTSLATYLSAAGLGVGVKDSFYLMDDDAGLHGPTHVATHGVSGYLDLFRSGPQPTVEVTAGYVYQKRALEFFAGWKTPPTFVVIVRDPVERLRSVHRYFTGNLGVLQADLSFDEYVLELKRGGVDVPDKTVADALSQGEYIKHIRPWVAAFGSDRVVVVNLDDLEERPADVTSRLVALAGGRVDGMLEKYEYRPRNQSFTPQSRALAAVTSAGRRLMPRGTVRAWGGEQMRRLQVRKGQANERTAALRAEFDVTAAELAAHYAPHNADLASELGVDISRWT